MSGCCDEPSRVVPRHRSTKCPRCAGNRIRELNRGLSVVWFECGTCGYVWQFGW